VKSIAAILLTIHCLTLGAGDIRLPMRSIEVTPDPVSETRVEPVDTLPIGELFIVESDAELIIRQCTSGLLTVREIAPGGIRPIGIDGLFAGGDRAGETRVFTGAHVYSFRGIKPGKLQVNLIPKGVLIEHESDAPLLVLTVSGQGPKPPPDPEPDPEPDDPTPPGPVTSFRVIWILESGDTLNAAQTAIPDAKAVRDYVNAKTTRSPDGQPGWRTYDPQQITTNEPEVIQELWRQIKRKAWQTPCVAIEVNTHTIVLPFPANTADALTLLKRYGGE